MSILTEADNHEQTYAKRSANFFSVVLSSLILSITMTMTPAYADNVLGEINIRLSGTVVAMGCSVDPNDVDKPVQLGGWATKQLKKAGEASSPVPFSIHLTGCTASGVAIAFTGQKDKLNPELLALKSDRDDYATGVAIQIMDSSGHRIPIANNSLRRVVDSNGNVTLNFRANYVATGNNSVRPGIADADSEFTLTYD